MREDALRCAAEAKELLDSVIASSTSAAKERETAHARELKAIRDDLVEARAEAERLRHDLQRYLTRKIGFEAVMRVRATRGISIHTFFGNFFVRSTDLVNLACINPDSG